MARKSLFYILIPLLFPVFVTISIVFIGGQGALSRLRVKKILKKQKSFSYNTLSTDSDSTVNQADDHSDNSNPILSATLDAINMTADDEEEVDQESIKEHKTIHTLSNWCNVEPSEPIKKYAQELPFDPYTLDIQKHLNNLPWQRVLVCLHTFNAHGSIVCRQSLHTNDHGKSVIKHFVDTIPL